MMPKLILTPAVVAVALGREVDANVASEIPLPAQAAHRLAAMCGSDGLQRNIFLEQWVGLRWQSLHAGSAWVTDASINASAAGGRALRTFEPGGQMSELKLNVASAQTAAQAFGLGAGSDTWTDKELLEFTLGLRAKDEKRLVQIGGKAKQIIISWTSGGAKYLPMALNLGESVRRNAPQILSRLVFLAMDREAHVALRAAGFRSVHRPGGADLEDDVWKMRWRILATVCRLGLGAVVLDTDMVVLGNPFKALKLDADLEVSTDHFFPERYLWLDWVRVEDNINTGFLWGRGARTASFLMQFIAENRYSWIRGIPRHKIDQNVFNRYVIRAMKTGHVGGYYAEQQFGKSSAKFRIRVLDPTVVCHGMNFFWRKAHQLPSSTVPPVVAHANGVDAKEYFLRDRGVWFLDDWDARWANEGGGRFLTYEHPSGLSLQQDFEHLVAGLQLAYYLQRRLVLPRTMNCANCPAYYAYGLNLTLQGEPGCSYDYFAWSQPLFGFLDGFFVEAGIVDHLRFKELSRRDRLTASPADMPDLSRNRDTRMMAVVHVTDVLASVRVLAHQGLMHASKLFQCSFIQYGWAWQACRDDDYVKATGQSPCGAGPAQQGCGYRALNCCMNVWGWGEKLEYYTGVAWDLPCNCGLAACERADEGSSEGLGREGVTQLAGSEDQCCQHRTSPKDPTCSKVAKPSELPAVNAGKDTHEYTGGLLVPFAEGELVAEEAWRMCHLHRRLSFGDRIEVQSLAHCTRLLGTWLLHAKAWRQLKIWLDFDFELRRGLPADQALSGTLSPMSMRDFDNREVDWDSVAHDVAQLEYLGSALPRSTQKLAALFRRGADTKDPSLFQWAYRRGVHAPVCSAPAGGDIWMPAAAQAIQDMLKAVDRNGYAVVDGVLDPEFLDALRMCLAKTTIWFGMDKSVGATSQLLDGLHRVEPVLLLARDLSEQHIRSPLLEVSAMRHSLQRSSIGTTSSTSGHEVLQGSARDGAIAAVLMAGRHHEDAGIRILDIDVGPEVPWAEAMTSRQVQRHEGISVAHLPGRLVLWRGERVAVVEPSPTAGSGDFANWRVDVSLLFGPRQIWPHTEKEREINY